MSAVCEEIVRAGFAEDEAGPGVGRAVAVVETGVGGT